MSKTELCSSIQDTVWAVNPETIGGSLFSPSSSYQLPTFQPHGPAFTLGHSILNSPLGIQLNEYFQLTSRQASTQSPPHHASSFLLSTGYLPASLAVLWLHLIITISRSLGITQRRHRILLFVSLFILFFFLVSPSHCWSL
ncbi:hypothetical protein PCASD_00493 [Puccinia coronata f. sp. avenae]|uniref:Uncharacterized protein n=1 Tax=Puccinia coronata f. sp. avenae TaxID=200324 RepID=A0A2N5VNN1_9BASI|nr:hypothetical protein PCASD_00493 [Puccinia coronata f. sp. avenae]